MIPQACPPHYHGSSRNALSTKSMKYSEISLCSFLEVDLQITTSRNTFNANLRRQTDVRTSGRPDDVRTCGR